jgi:mono/diheme cytochrome c family protein
MYTSTTPRALACAAAVLFLAACTSMRTGEGGMNGGDEDGFPGEDTSMARADTAMGGEPGMGGDTMAAAGEGAGAVTPEQVAQGQRIFNGRAAGGTCFSCHGAEGEGTANGPDLTDQEWLNTDGTLQGIIQVIREGVDQPKEFPAPMPPMGGARLSDEQVRAVAAYVHSLTNSQQ